MSFVIVTDSSANLMYEWVKSWNVEVLSLTYSIEGTEYLAYNGAEAVDYETFYNALREQKHVTTSLVNTDSFEQAFRKALERQMDVLYIAMSSSLSGTYQAAVIAAEGLRAEYPQRRIDVIDTLCTSLGQGLLVQRAAQMRDRGCGAGEIVRWIEAHKGRVYHFFTVDDLLYLKRGGRLSGATAAIGTLLQVKPVLRYQAGALGMHSKALGRRRALDAMIREVSRCGVDAAGQTAAVAHAGCLEEASYMAEKLRQAYRVREVLLHEVDPVLTAHLGVGAIGLFFIDEKTRLGDEPHD